MVRLLAPVAIVAVLVSLAVLNISARWTWPETEVEDGVLWSPGGYSTIAAEVAPGSPAEKAGVQQGDILLAIDGAPVMSHEQVIATLHHATRGQKLTYGILRAGGTEILTIGVAPIPTGSRALYVALACVGIFTLFVGAVVRLRRPENQATLHFFWLSVAFFGVLAFSFSGRLDPLDWVFYWGDVVALLLLPPLFVHFALVFPERPGAGRAASTGARCCPRSTSRRCCSAPRTSRSSCAARSRAPCVSNVVAVVERGELLYLALSLLGGLVIMTRALQRVRSVTARRQLRWIVWGTALGAVPFVFGYGLPYALGFAPIRGFELSAILLGLVPLAFASAIVRYRLMDVEVIIKRALVYAAALALIAAIYGILLQLAGAGVLPRRRSAAEPGHRAAGDDGRRAARASAARTRSRPVSTASTTAIATTTAARWSASRATSTATWICSRLSERLVRRVTETLVVDRMALMLAPGGGRQRRGVRHRSPTRALSAIRLP